MDMGHPYKPRWPKKSPVRVAPIEALEEFMRSYHYHHKLQPEQLKYAGVLTTITDFSFYHGGDVLYTLADTPGWEWLEPCLRGENVWDFISDEFRKNARTLPYGDVAWRGTDIRGVLKELGNAGAAILGLESVRWRDGQGPYVETISNSSIALQDWRLTDSWERCIALTIERSIFDMERNVSDPYSDNIWYIVCGEPAPG
jgi:hypothetical protein